MKFKDIPTDAPADQVLDDEQRAACKTIAAELQVFVDKIGQAVTVGDIRKAGNDLDALDRLDL